MSYDASKTPVTCGDAPATSADPEAIQALSRVDHPRDLSPAWPRPTPLKDAGRLALARELRSARDRGELDQVLALLFEQL